MPFGDGGVRQNTGDGGGDGVHSGGGTDSRDGNDGSSADDTSTSRSTGRNPSSRQDRRLHNNTDGSTKWDTTKYSPDKC